MTATKRMLKNNFVLNIANASRTEDSFFDMIWVRITTRATKIANNSKENTPNAEVSTKNQREKPSVTASALNLGEDSSILDRID